MPKTLEELRAEFDAEQKEKAEQAARDKAAADLEDYRVRAEKEFCARGGTPDEFKKAWPDIRIQYFRDGIRSPREVYEERMRLVAPTWR